MLLEICVEEPRKSWGKEQIVAIKERMLMIIIIMTYPGCNSRLKPADEGRRLACPRKPLVFRIAPLRETDLNSGHRLKTIFKGFEI